MSTFRWDITEPAEVAVSTLQGGTVQLDDIRSTAMPPQWSVKAPDDSLRLVPQESGEVKLTDRRLVQSIISRGVLNFAFVLLVLVVAFMMFKEAKAGTLTLERFLWLVVPPLTGHLGSRK